MSLIEVRQEGPVRTVTLNRPEKRNALTSDMLIHLHDAFKTEPDVRERVTVIRSTGRVFCAGRDLREQTGAEHGALFVWDKAAEGLVLVHHVVGGVTVTLPRVVRHDSAKAGIALHVYDTDQPYLAPDTAREPLYTRYLIDVGCIAAAPIRYQRRAIGVRAHSSS